MMSSVPQENKYPRRRFEYPLLGGPKAVPMKGGAEVEFDPQTRRDLLELLKGIEQAQAQVLSPNRRQLLR
jgi:hypothetical protein